MRPEALCCTSFNGEFTGMVEINNGGTFNATSLKMNLLVVFFQSSDLLMVWIQFSQNLYILHKSVFNVGWQHVTTQSSTINLTY